MVNTKGTLIGIVVALVTIGIVLGLGFMVLDEFGTNLDLDTYTVGNETIDPTTVGGAILAHHYNNTNCWDNLAITSVSNYSTYDVIESANYSWSEEGRLWNLTASEILHDGTQYAWIVNYTYESSNSEACLGIEASSTAVNKIPGWLAIIVVMLIIGIMLGLVFKVLPNLGKGSGDTAVI